MLTSTGIPLNGAAPTVLAAAGTLAAGIDQEGSTCFAAGGDLHCWGSGSLGQLGLGTTTDRNRAGSLVMGADSPLTGLAITKVAVGIGHACALDKAGKAYCWGANDSLELGPGPAARNERPGPFMAAETFSEIAVGGVVDFNQPQTSKGFTCVLPRETPKTIRCVGANLSGQLGTPMPTVTDNDVIMP